MCPLLGGYFVQRVRMCPLLGGYFVQRVRMCPLLGGYFVQRVCVLCWEVILYRESFVGRLFCTESPLLGGYFVQRVLCWEVILYRESFVGRLFCTESPLLGGTESMYVSFVGRLFCTESTCVLCWEVILYREYVCVLCWEVILYVRVLCWEACPLLECTSFIRGLPYLYSDAIQLQCCGSKHLWVTGYTVHTHRHTPPPKDITAFLYRWCVQLQANMSPHLLMKHKMHLLDIPYMHTVHIYIMGVCIYVHMTIIMMIYAYDL